MIPSKPASASLTITSELVLPNDTNTLNNLMGGRLLHLMDISAAISAQKHCNNIVVTASVDNVSFRHPIKLGDVISLESKITRAFHTSMEIRIVVWAENIPSGTKVMSNEAYYTFVAIDENSNTVPVPKVIAETEEEIKLYNEALQRRQLRLLLAGKLPAHEAGELKTFLSNLHKNV